jgi:RNA polymerase sigma factor (sigma-70 family)
MIFKKAYTDQELVDGCKLNDRRAQEALYKRYFTDMLRMCRRYTHCDDTSADIINIALLKVYQKIDTFTYTGSLDGWVRRIVYHCVADHFRGNGKYRHFIVYEESPTESIQTSTSNGNTLEESDLLRLIDYLPATSARVFRLYALEGFSHAEIAAELNMSEGNSKWHLFQARKRLQESLAKTNQGLYK